MLRRFQEAMDVADVAQMKRLVEENQTIVPEALDDFAFDYAMKSEAEVNRALADRLAQVWFEVSGDGSFARQFSTLRALDEDQVKRMRILVAQYDEAKRLYQKADLDRTPEAWREVAKVYEQILEPAEELGDFLLAGKTRFYLARVYEGMGNEAKYRETLARAEKDFALAGLKGGLADEARVARLQWEEAERKAAEATAGGATPSAEPAKTPEGVAYAEGSEWEESPLAYKASPDAPWRTPGFGSGEAVMTWGAPLFLEPRTKNRARFVIGGMPIHLVRDGAKFSLDLDGDEKGEIPTRVSTSPSLVEFTIPGKDGVRYGLRLSTPSQKEPSQGLQLNLVPREESAQVFYQRGCSMEGTVLGEPFALIDDNTDGIYGNVADIADAVEPFYPQTDAFVLGRSDRALPAGKILEKGGVFYALDIDPTGAKVRTRKLELPSATATVVAKGGGVPPSSLVLAGKGVLIGSLFDVAASKEVTLPAGNYELLVGKIEKGEGRGVERVLIRKGTFPLVTIQPGEKHSIEIGGPYTFTWQAREEGRDLLVVGNTVKVNGANGEQYCRFVGDVPLPEVWIRPKGGKSPVVKPEPMKRAALSDWQKEGGSLAIHFPLDFRWPMQGKGPFELRLVQKKHRLLGGPLESAWT
jgi:hypothetical protein